MCATSFCSIWSQLARPRACAHGRSDAMWCVYELAWWVHHKPKGKIVFVPLKANATLYGLLLNTMPLALSFLLFCGGMTVAMLLFWSNAFQDDRQLQKYAARNRSPHTAVAIPCMPPATVT